MAVDPRLVQAVSAQARAAGMDPLDLLTIMSYETGGTLNPWQRGPTTKWGTHRGLIQFGEPQAQHYQVGADTPVEQQVAASIRYLQDHGWRPGMGRLEMYAAINAGNVKNINARDAAAGGAPGTVQDKVNSQMAGHEARAKNLLSQYDVPGGYQPPAGANGNGIPGGVSPSDLPWGGGYTPAPQGVVSPATNAPAAPTIEPNSDAARALSDPARYGIDPAVAMQLQAYVTPGNRLGNIQPPATTVADGRNAPSAPPPGIVAPQGAAPAAPTREPTPEEREETRKYLEPMGPGPIGIWNPAKIWSQRPEYQQPAKPIGDYNFPPNAVASGDNVYAMQQFNDPNKKPLGLLGGW